MKMKLLMHEINVIRQKFSFTIAYYCGILLAGWPDELETNRPIFWKVAKQNNAKLETIETAYLGENVINL